MPGSPEAKTPPTLESSGFDLSLALRLVRKPRAAGDARRAVAERFDQLLAPDVLQDVLVVVSELVTNALRHGQGAIRIHLVFDGRRLLGEVIDQGAGFAPPVRGEAPQAPGGHGLALVGLLAHTWGVHTRPTRVWFEFVVR